MDGLLRIVLPLYLLTIFMVAIVWRSYLVYKRTGRSPVVVGQEGSTLTYVDRVYPIPAILLGWAACIFAVIPALYPYLGPLFWLEHSIVKATGLALMAVALVWIVIAQSAMGTSWRIGIDTANRTELIRRGPFRLSRNPIFLGMRVALAGFFLTLPNAVTLLALGLGEILLQIQVRLEEQHLATVHGEAYESFKREVRRWL